MSGKEGEEGSEKELGVCGEATGVGDSLGRSKERAIVEFCRRMVASGLRFEDDVGDGRVDKRKFQISKFSQDRHRAMVAIADCW